MRRSRRLSNSDPHLLLATIAAAVVVVLGIIALAETGSYWLVAITLAAVIAGAAMLAIDVGSVTGDADPDLPGDGTTDANRSDAIVPGPDFTGPARPARLLVVTSEPVDPRAILHAATVRDPDLALDRLGVMVVSPEGFGHLEVTNDERHYTRARDAEQATVAGLRRAGIAAAGHVGDHNPALAVDDALVLFDAQRTLVFAHGPLASAYRRRLRGRTVEIIELLDEPVPIRA